MSVKSGETVVLDFTTTNPTTGALANADALPTGVLVIDGTDNAATVTVTNKATGRYKASVAIPASQTTGKKVALYIAATIDAVACGGVIWQDTVDAKHVGDLVDAAASPTAAAIRAEMDANSTKLANLDVALSSRAADAGLSALQGDVTTLLSRLSSARAGYLDNLSAGAVALNADIATLLTRISATRAGYLDKLNVAGSVASAADVAGVTQAQRVRVIVPAMLERPDSGSTTYRAWIYAYGPTHVAESLDSNPVVTVENNAGVDRSANLGAVANPSTGVYSVDYTVANSHAIEGLVFKVAATEGGTTTNYAAPSIVVDTTAVDFTAADRTKLDTLHDARLTGARAALLDNLANLDAAISSRSTYAGADTEGTTTLLSRLSTTRAAALDYLDVSVASRLAAADGIALSTALPGTPTAGTVGEALAAALHVARGKKVVVEVSGVWKLRVYRYDDQATVWKEFTVDHPTAPSTVTP